MWGTSLAATIYRYIGFCLCVYYEMVGPTKVQFKKQKNTLKTSALLRLHSMFNVQWFSIISNNAKKPVRIYQAISLMIKIRSISELPVLQITDQVSFLLTYWHTRYTVLSVFEVEVRAWNNRITYSRQMRQVETFRLQRQIVRGHFIMTCGCC